MSKKLTNWKWSNGEDYSRSSRLQKQNVEFKEEINTLCVKSKRIEETLEREMLSQRGVNPFFKTSYVNDVVTRDIFLKPLNTTSEKFT
jgi:hypothetical protein